MDLRAALTGQYKAGLAMLRQCVERCPDDAWAAGEHPRTFWRIAYHAVFYTHFYLAPSSEEFTPWSRHQRQAVVTWPDDDEGTPPRETTFTPSDVLAYLDEVYAAVGPMVDALDLESAESGFSWYPIPKLDHQLVNIRHLGVHVGQLQEILYSRGVDLDWVGKR
jgi:hypothetical protein